MKHFLFYLLLFVSLVVVSCVNKKPLQPVIIENTKEITHTLRDTTYIVEKDSTHYSAWLECINGKPVLRDPQIIKSTSKDSGLQVPNVKLTGNNLHVDCVKDAQQLFKQWRETYVKEHEQKPIYVDVPVEVVKPLNWFQKTQIWFGRVFMALLAIITVVGILRFKRII